MTKIIKTIAQWQAIHKQLANKTIGLVTTMGNLHQGHASLLAMAKKENDIAVLTLFINPTQFNDPADFKRYPQTLEADIALAEQLEIDFIFIPTEAEMYSDHKKYAIYEKEMSNLLEGALRPGHFEGVLTIVMKLFNIILPQRAYFGEKDYQQLLLVQGMVKAFFLNIEIIPCPIIRDADQLALSSRNRFLTPEERAKAAAFPQALLNLKDEEAIKNALKKANIEVEYIEKYQNRLLGAVKIGSVRLIDNVAI